MKKIITLLLAFAATSTAFGQNFNRPVPSVLLPYEYNQIDTNINFYLGINMNYKGDIYTGDLDVARGVLFDPDGYIAWYQTTPANPNAMNSFGYNEANYVFTEVVANGPTNKQYIRIDTNFQIIDTITTLNVDPDSHEFYLATDGHRYLSTTYTEVQDLSAYTINGGPGNANTTVACNGVQEFDVNGNLVFEWTSCDEILPSEAYGFGYNVNNYDYFHINSIDLDEDDNNLLISARHINAIIKVNHTTGAVMWRLGGSNSDFTFVGDNGFSGQHDCRSEGNGIITLFDNANLAPTGNPRAVRYQLDTVNWTATVIGEFDRTPLVSGTAQGSFRTIGNYGVVGYGFALRPEPNVTIFDQSNTIAAEYFFTDSATTYRAVPSYLGFDLERPEITCFDSLGTLYLKAPDGFASYEWSDGSTTQTILPTLGEVYQV
ncbi:MAG: arylsulfotransferase family protein [Crocinitomicaceae bacterium]|nr:arylsulfotransferase family protein [Crocinitomicaceae bacterium]